MPGNGNHKIDAALNRVKLIRGGKPYFDLLNELIRNATDTIHLQTYIFDDDETGRQVSETLKKAAGRKVKVYLMVDGYASQALSHTFIKELKDSGISFRFFEPVFRSKQFYFGRRLHHKVLVVDNRYSLVGGINISDRYNDLPGHPAWLDFALYAEGDIARELCVLCWKTWKSFPVRMGLTPCEQNNISFDIPSLERAEVQMRRNDWVRRKNQISATYISMMRDAKDHITILCSYFLPGRVIRKLLSNASARGVRIRVITAGRSDVKLAKNAERWLYDWLLRNNIELYEYQQNILHGKVAVCDDEWMTIGSYNINNISAYASIELNLNVRDKKFSNEVAAVLEEIIRKDCIRITEEKHSRSRNILSQFIRWCSYEIVRLIFYLFTFYFKQRN